MNIPPLKGLEMITTIAAGERLIRSDGATVILASPAVVHVERVTKPQCSCEPTTYLDNGKDSRWCRWFGHAVMLSFACCWLRLSCRRCDHVLGAWRTKRADGVTPGVLGWLPNLEPCWGGSEIWNQQRSDSSGEGHR